MCSHLYKIRHYLYKKIFNFSTNHLIFKNHIVLNLLIQSNIDITKYSMIISISSITTNIFFCCLLYMTVRCRHDFAAHSPTQSMHLQILPPFCDVPQESEIVTSEIIIVFLFSALEYKIMTYIILYFFFQIHKIKYVNLK